MSPYKNISNARSACIWVLLSIISFHVDSFCTTSIVSCRNKVGFPSSTSSARQFSFRQLRSTNSVQPELPALPRCCLVLKNEKTDNEIILLGCLHGFPTSKKDVEHVLEYCTPGSIVLELCPSRFKSIRKELVDHRNKYQPQTSELARIQSEFNGWSTGIKKIMKEKGFLSAFTVGVISSSFLWLKINKFDPGCEFKKAILIAESRSIDVILGDRDIHETIERLNGKKNEKELDLQSHVSLTDTTAQVVKYFEGLAWDFNTMVIAVRGNSNSHWPEAVNIWDCVLGRVDILKDIIGLFAPLTVIMYVVITFMDFGIGQIATTANLFGGILIPETHSTSLAESIDLSNVWLIRGENVALLGIAFLILLRFFRLVIRERDLYLAYAIQTACERNPGEPIVAVLGLLHCNGVANLLQQESNILKP